MSDFTPCPKPGRIKDNEVYLDCYKDFCEVCGTPVYHRKTSKGHFTNGPHHIIPRGAGGPDCRENLIQLCEQHHTDADNGNLTKDECWRVVASREAMPIEDVRDACINGRRAAHIG